MNVPMPPPVPGDAPRLPPSPTPNVYVPTPARPTSTTAIVALIAGLLSWVLLPFIASIVAIIAGHMARSEIRRSNGVLDGDAMALAGMVLGYVQIGLTVLFVLGFVLFFGGLAAILSMTH
jgi:hypothetical protein